LHARLVDPAAAPTPELHTHPIRVGAQHLLLGRAWPFTATELSRAAALLELAAQLSLRAPRHAGGDELVIVLPDGSQVRLRTAGPTDGPLVAALHARCSPGVRRARFLSPTPQLGPDELEQLLGGDSGQAVVAVTVDGGSAVGIVTLSAPDDGVSRFGVLVEDTWQGRGLGTALLRRAADLATAAGATALTGLTRPDGVGVTRLMRRAGMLRPSAEMVGEEVHLHAQLAPVPVG